MKKMIYRFLAALLIDSRHRLCLWRWAISRPEPAPTPVLNEEPGMSNHKANPLYAAAAPAKRPSPFTTLSALVLSGTIFGFVGQAVAQTSAPGVVTGLLVARSGTNLTLQLPSGSTIMVDAAQALAQRLVGVLVVGQRFSVNGAYDGSGVLHAASILRAKPIYRANP
jgi:hypothetical protein